MEVDGSDKKNWQVRLPTLAHWIAVYAHLNIYGMPM